MSGIIISFYTDSYSEVSVPLRESLIAAGLSFSLRRVPDFPSWNQACAYKPWFIAAQMHAFPGRRLLWIDADAVVHADPWPAMLGPDEVDFGFHSRVGPRREGGEVLSGTLLLNPTPAARELVDLWCAQQSKTPTKWDQKVLALAMRKMGDRVRYQALPASMCMIFDSMRHENPGVEPVIEHFQASRQMRNR